MQPIEVQSLRIEAASGPTCYAGENGFSAVWGELSADGPELCQQLDSLVANGDSAVLRCGALEATCVVEHADASGVARSYRLRVKSVRL